MAVAIPSIRVTTTADIVDPDDDEISLREAIQLANSEPGLQLITFDASLAGGTIGLTLGQLEITDGVSIQGDIGNDGTTDITITADSSHRVLHVDVASGQEVTLTGLHIRDGRVDSDAAGALAGGAGIYMTGGGSLELIDSKLSTNRVVGAEGAGGAIYNDGSLVVLKTTTLDFNSAHAAGGGVAVKDGTLRLEDSSVTNGLTGAFVPERPIVEGRGGAIHTAGTSFLEIDSSDFSNNESNFEGGAIWLSDRTEATIANASFLNNSGRTTGGAIFASSGAHLDVTATTFAGNASLHGEAVGGGGEVPGEGGLDPMGLHFGLVPEGTSFGNDLGVQTVTGTEAGDVILGDLSSNELDGSGGNDIIAPLAGVDEVTLGAGRDLLLGRNGDFDGDFVSDFSENDGIGVISASFTRGGMPIQFGETATTIGGEVPLTLEGDFRGGNFLVGAFELPDLAVSGTAIGFLNHLPELAEGETLPFAASLDKPALDLFLGGNARYTIIINEDLDGAAFRNAVGVYEISPEGVITNVRIIDTDATDGGIGSVSVSTDGELGLFIIQDGADLAEDLVEGRNKVWFNEDGALVVNDEVQDELIFHATRDDLNSDGLQHAVAGTLEGNENQVRFGFEDLEGLGDGDYQDVVLTVTTEDVLLD
jgi:CSLREA domain-containing protein